MSLPARTETGPQGLAGVIDRYFLVSARGSTIATEVKAGVATFLTMSYILLVNPQILGTAGLPVQAVVTATALASMLSSLLCGLIANLPVGMSPGMGLNAYLVFSQVLGLDVSIEAALAGCAAAAVVVAVMAVIRALSLILAIVPDAIKLATVVGMGLLLSFIGLQTSKIVVPDEATMVTMGDLLDLDCILAISGVALIAALHYRNVKGSIIVGIMVTAIAFYSFTNSWPTAFLATPRMKWWALDFSHLVKHPKGSAWSAVMAYVLVMIFDIGGAMFGLGNLAGLVKDGEVPHSVFVYLSAAVGTLLGAFTGTTPVIIAAESAVGIKEGGRTGLVAVTISLCFMLSMFLAPFLQAIPQVATAPVLVLVGAMMMGESIHIDWSTMLTAVPSFLTIVIQPFTFSIANGIYAGLAMYFLLFFLTGNFLVYLRQSLGPYMPESWRNRLWAEEDKDEENPQVGCEGANGHRLIDPLLSQEVVEANDARSEGSALSRRVGSVRIPWETHSFTMLVNTEGSHRASTAFGTPSYQSRSILSHSVDDHAHYLDHAYVTHRHRGSHPNLAGLGSDHGERGVNTTEE